MTIDERVANLEGRTEEQAMRIDDVRAAVASLEARMDRRFEQLEQRLDQRFAAIDQRFTAIDQRFALIDQRFLAIDGRLDGMSKLLWALLIAIIGGMGGVIAAILQR